MASLRWLLALVLLTTASAGVLAQGDNRASAAQAARAMAEHRYDEAAAIYRELLKVTPDEPELHANLGMALAMGGHEAEAVPQLERAIALNPKLTNARVVLGSSYMAMGQPAKAIAALQHVVAARQRGFGMQQRVVLRRRLRESGDQRRLGQRQPLRRA